MSEELVKIEVDGIALEARKGSMLIEATDAAGIKIPRFCYHKKLPISANCRMCLVEVERAPKPLPACATPVMDGMKVRTASAKAIARQQSTMEFLLINHPLDCPICDQGGECELQDVAMGYGGSASRFRERKRVVKDKDIGPLIAMEMTRCILCTRCVRFGKQIAGLQELGVMGRGEHSEIGTYVANTVTSELSGNVIDLCPVGALTAKPSRFTGRSWEYVQHAGIAAHDSIGSNIYIHTIRGKVMRVVPRENEALNEVWLADRDRFSYQGVYSADRAIQPIVKGQASEWNTALEAAADGLKSVIDRHGADAIGFLVSPSATLEEMYLAQKLARGLGIGNIDHRLRQADFGDQDFAPDYPWLGLPLAGIEKLDAVLLIGSNAPKDLPIVGHRLRKAALAGAGIMAINPRDFEFRFPLAAKAIVNPAAMVTSLIGVAKAVARFKGVELPGNLKKAAKSIRPDKTQQAMADNLVNGAATAVFLGNLAVAHPAFSQLRALAAAIAKLSGATMGYLPEAANSVGGWLAGTVPHRLAGAEPVEKPGLDARAMLESPRKAYMLLGVEPEFDCWDPATALAAVTDAELVVALTPYASERTKQYAKVILPTATFAETSGTYINAEGDWQSFQGACQPLGESRPAWKILRVLGNLFDLPGFDYTDSQEVLAEIQAKCNGVDKLADDNEYLTTADFKPFTASGLMGIADIPIYAIDATVRRASALQQTPLAETAKLYVNPTVARQLKLSVGALARIRQNGKAVELPVVLDEGIPNDCAWIARGLTSATALGPSIGSVEIDPAG